MCKDSRCRLPAAVEVEERGRLYWCCFVSRPGQSTPPCGKIYIWTIKQMKYLCVHDLDVNKKRGQLQLLAVAVLENDASVTCDENGDAMKTTIPPRQMQKQRSSEKMDIDLSQRQNGRSSEPSRTTAKRTQGLLKVPHSTGMKETIKCTEIQNQEDQLQRWIHESVCREPFGVPRRSI